MELHPLIDKENKYVSPFLKMVIGKYGAVLKDSMCLDIPCGNGRNTFFLAGHFSKIMAVDINADYLQAIRLNAQEFPVPAKIELYHANILSKPVQETGKVQLICNIHFYHPDLIKNWLMNMSDEALLLVETPGCQGRNFEVLPNSREIETLIKGQEVLFYEFKVCKHPDNLEKRGKLKLLIKKRMDHGSDCAG
ncbi:class I SAM-dependent methyltransferase [Mucilaginibacter angelicae]|uniref:Class I SAM-dependent methyltransferase n=1 Tax=Mucilaginibacter angelicae TaxID=869718 RepID=A0ABV6L1E1_9SPHI